MPGPPDEAPAAAVEAIIAGLPTSFPDAREQVVYEAAMALAGGRLVPQGLHDRAVTVLGHETVTDMVVLMGPEVPAWSAEGVGSLDDTGGWAYDYWASATQ